MNHLLSNIINTTRSRRVESNHSGYSNRRGRNIFANAMSLNNRHRRQSSLPIDNENTTIENELQDISNNIIQPYNHFNRNAILQIPLNANNTNENIDISNNALTGYINNSNTLNDESRYYSTFSYNDSNVRYFHNSLLNENETSRILNYIFENIYENQLMNILNDTQPETNHENNLEDIFKIKQNTIYSFYSNLKHISKNDTCPITMEEFKENDMICLLKNCNHSIEVSGFEKYIITFNTCPLCKTTLINI